MIEDFQVRSRRLQSRGRKRRKRVFESAILPVSMQLLKVEKNLDYLLFPDNTPEKVQHLLDSLQSVRLRLQSVEATYTVAESESPELMKSIDSVNEIWRKRIPDILEKWARLEQTDTPAKEWRTHSTLSRDLEQQLGKLQQDNKLGDSDRQDLVNVYAVIGSVQSLLDAISELGDSMKQINWRQWAIARF